MAPYLLSLLLLSYIGSTVGCDSEWKGFQGNCYYFETAKTDFWSAQDECQSMNAELTSVLSKDESDYLKKNLNVYSWIGLYMSDFGLYRWTDGNTQTFENWDNGEPNDYYGSEKCVIAMNGNAEWKDQNCGIAYGYVCKERKGTQPPATLASLITQGKCPAGFMSEEFSNKCYKLEGGDGDATGDLEWDWAYNACLVQGADFASITSAAEQSFVLLLMEGISSDVWIGLAEKSNEILWMDNALLDYDYFAPYDSSTAYFDCFALDRKTELLGQWIRTDCDFQLMYLCEAEREPNTDTDPPTFEDEYTDPACSDGYFRYHSHCYKFYEEEKSWDDASDACIQDGGQLAITVDLFEVARFTYESAKNGVTKDAWIGIQYEKSTGAYTWGDDYLIMETFWAYSEPDMDEDRACVSVNDMAWYDTDCNTQLPFFCVVGDVSDLITPASSTYGGTCEGPDDELWEDWCYYVTPEGEFSWTDANELCQSVGMELASVHSKVENDFLEQYVDTVRHTGSLWIGLMRAEESFRWSDGTSFNFALWNPGEPNSSGEECVEFQADGEWNDLDCNGKTRGYICKGDKIPPTTTSTTTTTTTTTTATTTTTTTPTIDRVDMNSASLDSATGMSGGAIAGTVIAAIIIVLVLALGVYLTVTRRWSTITGRFSKSRNAFPDSVAFVNNKVTV